MRDVKVGRAGGHTGLGEVLLSSDMRRLVESRANTAAMLYQALVAKRTGQLARDVKVSTYIGGDRWRARVTVGENIVHDLPHEFGHDRQNGPRVDGAEDLKKVLRMLAAYT